MARIALVSCVKSKLPSIARAEDLYVSDLFRSMRRYAETQADDWFILSAKHGLVRRDEVVEPYEKTLLGMRKADRMAWGEKVQKQLAQALPAASEVIILAGERYREHLVPFLEERGFQVSIPMKGKSFGAQLRWLKEQNREQSDC